MLNIMNSNPSIIIINGIAKNCIFRCPFRLTLHHLQKISICSRSSRLQIAVQSAHVLHSSLSLQSFIIFLGMCTIVLFRPWMKDNAPKKTSIILPQDNKYLYIMPSFLDVFGTIVDTTGLFYVNFD